MSARYAIYFAPAPGSAWWRFGAGSLGRDELRDVAVPQVRPPAISARQFAAVTAEPRRYGFHATLKAPFPLRDGLTEGVLRERVARLAGSLQAAPLGALVPQYADGFVALVPTRRLDAVDTLAAQCVEALDDLRGSPIAGRLARHRHQELDERGRELLLQYGYPHVFERFRFHMTLTGPVERAVAEQVVLHVAPLVLRLQREEPLRLDRLCLFCEPQPGAAFLRLHDEVLAP
jgi:hypothetical protein